MSLRQIYETDDATPSALDDEYVDHVDGITGMTTQVGISCMMRKKSDVNYYQTRMYLFDAISGAAQGYVVNTTNGLVTRLRMGPIVQLLSGALFNEEDLDTRYVDDSDYSVSGNSVFPATGYWGGEFTRPVYIFDDLLRIWVQYDDSVPQSHVNTYNTSDGSARGISVGVGGTPDHLALTGKGTGVSFANNIVTFFNYEYGIIYSVSRLPNLPAGATWGQREYTYDLHASRILLCDGDRLQVQGLSPIPVPHGITQPIACREPRTHDSVRLISRVFGSAGEGIAGATVTFADEGVGEVSPQTTLTDAYGYAEVAYDGLTVGGAETITATVGELTVPEKAPDQGGGASAEIWEPTVILNFGGQSHLADVSGLESEQRNWIRGTDGAHYGTSATEFYTRIGTSSVANLKLKASDLGGYGQHTSTTGGGAGGSVGLVGAEYDIDFSEESLVADEVVTDQFAAYGITFPNATYFNPTGYGSLPGSPPPHVSNFDGTYTTPFENMRIEFDQPVYEVSFRVATNAGSSTFNAYREGALIGSHTGTTSDTDTTNFYGFYGTAFDAIEVVAPQDNACLISEIQYNSIAHAFSDTGIFGGSIIAPVGIGQGEEVWVGCWVRIPTGFDFTNSAGILPLFWLAQDEGSETCYFGYKDNGSSCDGYTFTVTGRTITETDHSFVAHADAMFTYDEWHFMQFYVKPSTDGANTVYRAWIDSTLIYELSGTAGKRFVDTSSTLTSFTSAESYPMLNTAAGKVREVRFFSWVPGYTGGDQSLQISAPFWAENQSELLQFDSHGNRYLSPVRAATL